MRDVALVKLLNDLRIEARLSLNPAHNDQQRDYHVGLLQLEQERLWEDHDWPHLSVHRDQSISAGQRYYSPPADMRIDRIEMIEAKIDGRWRRLQYGIGPDEYHAHDSDLDQRAWPPCAWQIYEDEQIEIWPISDQNVDPVTENGTLRITGTRNLRPLVAAGDRCDLDDKLLVLFTAGQILASNGSKDAQMVMEKANRRLATLRANLQQQRTIDTFNVHRPHRRRRRVVAHYRPPTNY